MSYTDPIADMLTRIRNASAAGLETVDIPHSKLKDHIAGLLKKEGFIRDFGAEAEGARKTLRVYLKYAPDGTAVLKGLRRISTPGCRRYAPASRLPRVRNGLGIAILTTSTGIMTDREARRAKVGGEVLCHIW